MMTAKHLGRSGQAEEKALEAVTSVDLQVWDMDVCLLHARQSACSQLSAVSTRAALMMLCHNNATQLSPCPWLTSLVLSDALACIYILDKRVR